MTDLDRNTDPRHDAKIARGLRWTLEHAMVDLRDATVRAEIVPAEDRTEVPS